MTTSHTIPKNMYVEVMMARMMEMCLKKEYTR